jgi:hypothetical protein
MEPSFCSDDMIGRVENLNDLTKMKEKYSGSNHDYRKTIQG